jgi:hypothetical protein
MRLDSEGSLARVVKERVGRLERKNSTRATNEVSLSSSAILNRVSVGLVVMIPGLRNINPTAVLVASTDRVPESGIDGTRARKLPFFSRRNSICVVCAEAVVEKMFALFTGALP